MGASHTRRCRGISQSYGTELITCRYVVSLVKGDSGSIFLLWSVPDHAIRFVAAAMNSEFLECHGIEEVTIDGEKLEEYKHQHDLVHPKFKMISQV